MSKKIEETVVEVVEEAKDTAVDQQVEEVKDAQPIVVANETQPKKGILSWSKEHVWQIAAAVAAGATVIFLGKKIYQAGMPAEFELPESVSDIAEDVEEVVLDVNSEE